MTTLEKIRSLYALLDERGQMSVLFDITQGGQPGLSCSDAFADALLPVSKALDAAHDGLMEAAERAGA